MDVAHQAHLSMGFSWQEYWSGLPCPPPEDSPFSGIEAAPLTSPALADRFFTTNATWEVQKRSTSSSKIFVFKIMDLTTRGIGHNLVLLYTKICISIKIYDHGREKVMKIEACLRPVENKKRDSSAGLVQVYHWRSEHVNDDLLIQAINDTGLGGRYWWQLWGLHLANYLWGHQLH